MMKLVQKITIAYIRIRLALLAALSEKKAARKAFDLFCTPMKRTVLPASPLFARAERCTVQVEGVTVHGFRWNKGGGKRVQLVHGYESAAQNFELYVRAFIDKGYEVLAFDAPAHGVSDGRQITLPLYIATLRAIALACGPVDAYLAHSFGGLALVLYLESCPPDDKRRVALVAPATEISTAIDQFFQFLHLGQGVRREFDAFLCRQGHAPATFYAIPRAIGALSGQVLWIHDRDDSTTPLKDVIPVIDKHYPHVHFILTEGLGHRRIYRAGSVIKAVTDFL